MAAVYSRSDTVESTWCCAHYSLKAEWARGKEDFLPANQRDLLTQKGSGAMVTRRTRDAGAGVECPSKLNDPRTLKTARYRARGDLNGQHACVACQPETRIMQPCRISPLLCSVFQFFGAFSRFPSTFFSNSAEMAERRAERRERA